MIKKFNPSLPPIHTHSYCHITYNNCAMIIFYLYYFPILFAGLKIPSSRGALGVHFLNYIIILLQTDTIIKYKVNAPKRFNETKSYTKYNALYYSLIFFFFQFYIRIVNNTYFSDFPNNILCTIIRVGGEIRLFIGL